MASPTVVVLHYHLNRGGVSSVILNQLRCLAQGRAPWRALILHGGRARGWPATLPLEAEARVVSGLDYDGAGTVASAPGLAEAVEAVLAQAGVRPGEAVLHCHNPALGKNRALPRALQALAEAGYALLIQVHDFAEDQRPTNYRQLLAGLGGPQAAGWAFPQASHVHYAVLNGRDRRFLEAAGVPPERLWLLPNPVLPPPASAPARAVRQELEVRHPGLRGRRLLLYPVRGIRRKNLGEMLLWAAALQGEAAAAVSLTPLNPVEARRYQLWAAEARRSGLPCFFGLGEAGDFEAGDLMGAADWLLTTSVAEGFGLAFLEGWLVGRPLTGRDLPEITGDFRAAGLALPDLAPAFRVPSAWVPAAECLERATAVYEGLLRAYGLEGWEEAVRRWRARLEASLAEETVDFALLDVTTQQHVVRRAAAAPEALAGAHPGLRVAARVSPEARRDVVVRNARAVREAFGEAASAARLEAIYRALLAAPRSALRPLPAPETLLRGFLAPERFVPLRVEP